MKCSDHSWEFYSDYREMPSCLEGQGDLVSKLITPINHIITLVIPIINLLTKSPIRPSKCIPCKPRESEPLQLRSEGWAGLS